jgi:hypothetical protein
MSLLKKTRSKPQKTLSHQRTSGVNSCNWWLFSVDSTINVNSWLLSGESQLYLLAKGHSEKRLLKLNGLFRLISRWRFQQLELRWFHMAYHFWRKFGNQSRIDVGQFFRLQFVETSPVYSAFF